MPNQGDAERRDGLWGLSKGDAGPIRVRERPFTVCPQIPHVGEAVETPYATPLRHPHSIETSQGGATEIWSLWEQFPLRVIERSCLSETLLIK
jgi:hypothetical protein